MISNRSTSSSDRPARAAFGIAVTGDRPVATVRRYVAHDRTVAKARADPTRLMRSRARGGIVGSARISGGDGESLDLRGSGLSAANFSAVVVPRRGCSSMENSPRGVLSRHDPSSNRPSSIAAIAFWCDRNAQASICSRETRPPQREFQPTVIDMSRLGRPAHPRVGGIHGSIHSSSPTRSFDLGEVDAEFPQPARISESCPPGIDPAADQLPTVLRRSVGCWPAPVPSSPAVIAARQRLHRRH